MKAIIWSQLNPAKTMKQLIDDRNLFRLLALAGIVFS
jgi:hypothetical protein